MIKPYEISNYVSECYERFEKEFLNAIGKLDIEDDINNYKYQLDNTCHNLLTKHSPNAKSFLNQYENHFMEFGARALFVSMQSDYSIKCHKLILENINSK